MLLILGVMAALRLPIREFPDVSRPIVGVSTYYRGANASVIESRITQVLEDGIAGVEGVDKVTSSSRDEFSRINIEFGINRDLDAAANDVRERVSRTLAALPQDAEQPQITKVDDGAEPIIYINLLSQTRSALALTDYADRILVDRFGSIEGVARERALSLLGANVNSSGQQNQGQPNIGVFGISGSKRIEQLPNTPTFAEQGYDGVNDVSVAGVWAPAATPKPILDALKKAMADAMKVPEVTVQLTKAGQILYTGTPEQFQADIEKDGVMYDGDFKRLGVELQ